MKNTYVNVPLMALETMIRCLTNEQLGQFTKNMVDHVRTTDNCKLKDSDMLNILATTVGCPFEEKPESIVTEDVEVIEPNDTSESSEDEESPSDSNESNPTEIQSNKDN